MRNIFFQFGHAGWWEYFAEFAKELSKNKDVKISGITIGIEAKKGLENYPYKVRAIEDIYGEIRSRCYDITYIEKRVLEIEQTYGLIWKYAYADRQLLVYHHNDRYGNYELTHNEIIKIIVGFFDYFEFILDENKIDSVFHYATASAPALIVHDIIKKRAGEFFQIGSLRYPDRVTFWNDAYFNINKYDYEPEEKDYEYAEQYYTNFKLKLNKPDWFTLKNTILPSINRIKNLRINKDANQYKKEFKYFDVADPGYFTPSLRARFRRYINWTLNNLNQKIYNIFDEIPNNKYAYFPLHLVPEAALMTMAPYYLDQGALIQNISKSLPGGMLLCVKDHPYMLNKRPIDFYKRIHQIPNVVLLRPSIDSGEIVKKSSCVLSVTGSTGLEGFLHGKPVIMFGKTHFCGLNGINFFNKPIYELSSFIYNAINSYTFDRKSILDYLARSYCNSIAASSSFTFMKSHASENVAKYLLQMYNLKYKK